MTEQLNPLLSWSDLPPFNKIRTEDIVPAIKTLIDKNHTTVDHLLLQLEQRHEEITWQNLCQPFAEVDNQLARAWSPISHLNAVKNSTELREAYEQCLPLLSEYSTWLGQHKKLYQAYKSLKEGKNYTLLTSEQRKSVDNALRDFELSGVGLTGEKQLRYGEIVARLSELSSSYSNNVLDATMGWSKLITDKQQLLGMPESALAAAKNKAEAKGQKGWLLTLDIPSYLPVITYCDNRDLRYEIFYAYSTRASDQGPNAGKWDNTTIMREILALRYELAKLLGFATYADKSLATKMVETPQQALEFLNDLATRAKPKAEKELAELKLFAKSTYSVTEIEAWDISYYSEKQKQHLYSIDDEQLRPYFPEQKVLNGLFEVIKRVFSITVVEKNNIENWSPEVRFFELYDQSGELRGRFYLDLYARENKRGGAWMDDCVSSLRFANGQLQKPVAYLTCNFNRPIDNQPALFTHNEVTTLFHEFGHGIHHMLTKVDTYGVSGINGVPWDAVELPSQFLENWCWQSEALSFISGHYKTGEPLPDEMLNKLLAAKNYQAGLFILRQLEFGIFDFRLHYEYKPEGGTDILTVLHEVKQQISVLPILPWGRFPHAFSHIFAGGYAAGYYSYLWAEVLSSDAFSRFEEEGIFNQNTGNAFLDHILTQGGSEDPMTLFVRFRGRKPNLNALLNSYGIQ